MSGPAATPESSMEMGTREGTTRVLIGSPRVAICPVSTVVVEEVEEEEAEGEDVVEAVVVDITEVTIRSSPSLWAGVRQCKQSCEVSSGLWRWSWFVYGCCKHDKYDRNFVFFPHGLTS
mmetsp:Transcript_2786/g.5064  ORF Transcript_2786/g.5064 Transcript_2786/m.5064 type:complete len:119 (-) Transcript_2786:170-526(-)